MDFKIEAKSPRKKKAIALLMGSVQEQLKLDSRSAGIMVLLSNELPEAGYAMKVPDQEVYLIVLNSSLSLQELVISFCHEMVHVAQFVTGKLKNLGDLGWAWNGKHYSWETPYMTRPWELQAYAKQNIIANIAVGIN